MFAQTLSFRRAQRHEALYTKLERLSAQVDKTAVARPGASVPEAMRGIAEGLLFDAQAFGGTRVKGGMPVAARDFGGLAAQIGQALARLESFEAQHASWDIKRQCHVWHIGQAKEPILRHRPEQPQPTRAAIQNERERAEIRDKLIRRIAELKRP